MVTGTSRSRMSGFNCICSACVLKQSQVSESGKYPEEVIMLDKALPSAPFRVLLADDEVPFRSTTARLLERHGFVCVQVSTADEAAERLGQETFDVLVADIRMPGNDRLD